MSDMQSLTESRVWVLACKLARRMLDISALEPFSDDTYLKERIKAAAVKLPSRVFVAFDVDDVGIRQLHLSAATDSARELRHYLSLASRSGKDSNILIDEAQNLSYDLVKALHNRLDGGQLAATA